MALKFTAEEYEAIEPGIYRAKLGDIKEDETKFGPAIKFYFEILDEDYEGQTLQGICNVPERFTSATKIWQWAQALLGRPIEAGENVDFSALVGRQCMITISHKETDRGTFARVDAVNPVRRKKAKPAPPPEPEEDEDEDDLGGAPF